MRVAICDYGAGNTRSVEIAFARLGARFTDDVAEADLAVLPGVGSARSAIVVGSRATATPSCRWTMRSRARRSTSAGEPPRS